MKKNLIAVIFIFASVAGVFAQNPEKLDITSYTAPNGWQKKITSDAVFFTIEDKGIFCSMTLFRAFDAKGDSKANFNAAWQALAAESFKLTSAPQMQPAASENGWTVESGLAPFEKDGAKGILMLITASGGGKMVNLLVLTNTDTYQNQVSQFVESLKLPPVDSTQTTNQNMTQQTASPQNNVASGGANGITKSTTNFSDGWTATVQPDYVLGTKGNLKIFLFYPIRRDSFKGEDLDYIWQNYVQALFNPTSKNFVEERPYRSLGYGEGSAVEKQTGRQVYILMTILTNNGITTPMIAAAPDRQTLFAEFPTAENLAGRTGLNRFAVTAADIAGNWNGGTSASALMVNIYTGQNAGMNASAMSDQFTFGANGAYTSMHKGATGMVGSQQFYQGKFNGQFTVADWEMSLSNRENGRTTAYNAYFEAVKGGKILHLIDKQYSGSGFNLVKVN